jgi:F-box domain
MPSMPSIPIDVLQEILEHVDKTDLATLCRVSKIFCAFSQDVLYREIEDGYAPVIQTLAQSTDLARRVRLFANKQLSPELATALRNMPSLRSLELLCDDDASLLDGCTFKLESFICPIPYSESLHNFLICQPSLTYVYIGDSIDFSSVSYPFEETFLPNLTQVAASDSFLRRLIPGRPLRLVTVISPLPFDLSFFTLSTTPIQKFGIDYRALYPKPVSLLVSIFPSLEHLVLDTINVAWTVRVPLCFISNR